MNANKNERKTCDTYPKQRNESTQQEDCANDEEKEQGRQDK